MQEPSRPAFHVSIAAIILFQVAALFARSMLDLQLQRNGMDADVAKDLSYLVVPPILLVLMFPYLRRCRPSLFLLFLRADLSTRTVACSIALGLTLRLMWWASTTFLIGIGVFRDQGPSAIIGPVIGFECPPLPVLALSLFVMACLTPLTEEVICRGFLLHRLLPKGKLLAIVVSSILFAVLHKFQVYGIALLVGVVLAYQTLNYRSLWGPVLTHATYNAAAIIDWACFRLIWNPAVADSRLRALTWISLLVMVIGAATIARLVSKKMAGAQLRPGPTDNVSSARSRRAR